MSTEDVGSGQPDLLTGRGHQNDVVASCAGNGDHSATGLTSKASRQCSVPHGASAGNYKPIYMISRGWG